MDTKGRFLSESEIDISNCQIHMPNHYLKFEILKLSSITVECCISVSVLNLIHQESNHPIMFIFFGYWLHLFCLLCSVLITKTALLDCMPPENVSCVLINRVGKFKWKATTYLFGNENVANIFLTISDLYKCFKIVLDCFLVHENMKKQSSKVAHNS